MIIPREGETPPPADPPDETIKNAKQKNLYKETNKNATYLVMVEAD